VSEPPAVIVLGVNDVVELKRYSHAAPMKLHSEFGVSVADEGRRVMQPGLTHQRTRRTLKTNAVLHARQFRRTATAASRPGARGGHAVGIVKEKVVPRPSVLSTQIRPPWASTMPLVMGRPSPAP